MASSYFAPRTKKNTAQRAVLWMLSGLLVSMGIVSAVVVYESSRPVPVLVASADAGYTDTVLTGFRCVNVDACPSGERIAVNIKN